MVLTRPIRLAATLALAAGCLTAPAAYGAPARAATCTGVRGGGNNDINGDGYDDAVIGDPAANDGDRVAAGAVRVLYGGKNGPGSGGATTLTGDSPGVTSPGTPGATSGDGFGYAVTMAHINNDACADVVIGAPWRTVDGRADAGAVYVVYGSPQGLGKGRAGTMITPDVWIGGRGSTSNSLFGLSLDGADARGGEGSAVAIGAPYTDRPGKPNAGAAYVMWFGPDGTPRAHKRYFEDQPRTAEGSSTSGLYGWAVALTRMAGDANRLDLAVGAPREPWNKAHQPGTMELLADVSRPKPSLVTTFGPAEMGLKPGHPSRIGFALASAAAKGTHYLAVAAPGAQIHGHPNAGAVTLFRSNGRTFSADEVVTEGTHGSTTAVEDQDQYGRSVALGVDPAGHLRLGVGAPYETSRVRHDGAAQIIPITGGGKARDLNQMLPGVPGDPGPSAHFGWSVRFTGGSTLLAAIPDDREYPTGSVIEAPVNGPIRRILPPSTPAAVDFGMGL